MKAFLTEWLIKWGTGWVPSQGPDWVNWREQKEVDNYNLARHTHKYLRHDIRYGCGITQKGLDYLKEKDDE